MLTDQSLEAFGAALASREPTPGGGSAAAAVAAFGSALGSMAARFTQGKKDFADHEAALADEIERLEAARRRFLELVDLDAEAYQTVRDAYALPRGTPEDKARRKAAIQEALRSAMAPPLEMTRLAVDCARVLASLAGHVTSHLASDVVVAAHLACAAARSAWVNVLINLGGVKDEGFVAKVLEEGAALRREADDLEARITVPLLQGLQP